MGGEKGGKSSLSNKKTLSLPCENLLYDSHSLVDWAGTERFISHATIARHEKFKQLLDK